MRQVSHVRPNRLFSADEHIILYGVGHLKLEKLHVIVAKIVEILSH